MILLGDLLERDADISVMLEEIGRHCDAAEDRCNFAESKCLPGLEAIIRDSETRAKALGVDHADVVVRVAVGGAWLVANGTLIALTVPTGAVVAALTGIALVLGEVRSRLDSKKTRSIPELKAIAARLWVWIRKVRDMAKRLRGPTTTLSGAMRYLDSNDKKQIRRIATMPAADRAEFAKVYRAKLSSLIAVDKKLLSDLRRADAAVA
jgi:hypothetical protein